VFHSQEALGEIGTTKMALSAETTARNPEERVALGAEDQP
jgi:hypothetical protein